MMEVIGRLNLVTARTQKKKKKKKMKSGSFFVAAIDQGTSSTRVVVYDNALRAVRVSQRSLHVHSPRPGWLEMDGAALLRSVDECLEEATRGLPSLRAIGLANQRETTVAMDARDGSALAPAILWSDLRTASAVAEWPQRPEWARLSSLTGLPASPYFSASKASWLLQNEPAVKLAAEQNRLCFGTVDAFVLRHLTGEFATDASNASRTLLFDLAANCWSEEALLFHGISSSSLLPSVRPSLGGPFGRLLRGPFAGSPVTAVLGDQQAALLGQGCLHPGDAKATFGTGCFLLRHAGERAPLPAPEGLVATVALQRGDGRTSFALEGSVGAAGSVVGWLREQMGFIGSFGELDEVARESDEECGGVTVVPAFGGLLAPHWKSGARAAVLGLSLGSTRADIVRACLAGIANCVADVVEAMEVNEEKKKKPLRVDGGLSASRSADANGGRFDGDGRVDERRQRGHRVGSRHCGGSGSGTVGARCGD